MELQGKLILIPRSIKADGIRLGRVGRHSQSQRRDHLISLAICLSGAEGVEKEEVYRPIDGERGRERKKERERERERKRERR